MSDFIEFNLKIKAKTDSAIMVEDFDGDNVWLPLSQIELEDDDFEVGDEQTIDVPEWLAFDKKLI